MLVIGIMAVLAGMAVLQIGASRPGLRGDGAMRVVLGQMNQARELAITQRRYMRVTFVAPNVVQIIRENTNGTTTTLSSVALFEGGVAFALVPGLPDTPDAFGQASALAFPTPIVKWTPEGTLISPGGQQANGTVFVSWTQQKLSARAVTVLGSTGRVRGYRWDGKAWRIV